MFDKFGEYMFFLLHAPFKEGKKKDNQLYIFFTVIGKIFDQIKQDMFLIREQSMIESSTGRILDEHGRDRKMPRLQGEDDSRYRTRLMMKAEIAARAGTKEGLYLALKSLGYEAEITPLYETDKEKWAEFYIMFDDVSSEIYDFESIKMIVHEVKQASAKPHYGFRYTVGFENSNTLSTKVYCIMAINFYDNIPLYLDGMWHLDGTYLLNGNKLGARDNSHTSIKIQAGINNEMTLKGNVQIDATWYLDGTYLLDGNKKLNGATWREELV